MVADGNYFSASLIPATVQPSRLTPPQLAQLHASVDAAGLAGRYVSADARSALIEVAFLEADEAGGRPFSQRLLARAVQETVAAVAASGPGRYSVEVLGEPLTIAALYGELPRAAQFALAGLALMLLIGSLLIGSPRIAVMVLACALLALLWQLGLMRLSGLMITPESVFALSTTMSLSVLGGMLLAARWLSESADGARAGFEASLRSWRKSAASIAIASAPYFAAAASSAARRAAPSMVSSSVTTLRLACVRMLRPRSALFPSRRTTSGLVAASPSISISSIACSICGSKSS